MKKKLIMIAIAVWICMASSLTAQRIYKFRVFLKDKAGTEYTTENPGAFLSKKSLERRARQHIHVTESDLPVSKTYVNALRDKGGAVCSG